MKKTFLIIPAILFAMLFSITVQAGSAHDGGSVIFTDVKRNHWAYPDIRKLAGKGIITGYSDGTFKPDTTMERQEFSVIISRLLEAGSDKNKAGLDNPQPFIDVSADMWSYTSILKASPYLDGYRGNDGKKRFMPESPALRSEIITALVKFCGFKLKSANVLLLKSYIDDTGITARDQLYAALALQYGLIAGFGDGTFRLGTQITRAEACAMLVRAAEKSGMITFPEQEPLYLPDIDSGFYDSFFNDAVLIGDSVTLGLRNYVLSQRAKGLDALGDARFLAAGSYSLRVSSAPYNSKNVNLTYQGDSMSIEDCLSAMAAREVYIMLGMNDLTFAKEIDCKKNYATTIEKIQAKNPDIKIYIQLCTPITKDGEKTNLNNRNMDLFNEELKVLCDEYGLEWLDINTPLKGEDNCLIKGYSSDNYVHMSYPGCDVWVNTLREFARKKYLSGEWDGSPSI